MKGVGKIGSALAAFEDNIAKNHVHDGVGRSFLTTIAGNPCTPKKVYKSISKPNSSTRKEVSAVKIIKVPPSVGASLSYDSYHGEDRCNSLHTSGSNSDSKHLDDGEMFHTSYLTDDSVLNKIQQPILNSQFTGSDAIPSQKGRTVRKVAIVRSKKSDSETTSSAINLDSPTMITIKELLLNDAILKRRNFQLLDAATTDTSNVIQSPTEKKETANEYDVGTPVRGNRLGKIRLSGKSPLQKIAATIKRVNSSNSLREAATAALQAVDTTTRQKSPSSRSSRSRTKLSEYVDQTTPNSAKKIVDKSVTSLPITSVTIAPGRQQSFSSMQITSPSLGINNAVQGANANQPIDGCSSNISPISRLSVQSPDQKLKAESANVVDSISRKSNSDFNATKTMTRLSDYVNHSTEARHKTDKSVTSLPITSIITTSAFQESFSSLPVTPPSCGIAVAARRSTIKNIESDAITLVETEATSSSNDDNAITTQSSDVQVIEDDVLSTIDMEYGPHNMPPIRVGPRHTTKLISTTSEHSVTSGGESLCGTETTPTGIAKAARRSSMEFISISRADSDEIISTSGITTLSEDSTMESCKTDDQDQTSLEGRNGRKYLLKSNSSSSLFSLDLHRRPKKIQSDKDRKVDEDYLLESFSSVREEFIFLPRRAEVVGILRAKLTLRNQTRHVKFADQQPDGGRRMSFHKSVKNDSLPVRPRRSNNFELDRLRNLRQKQKSTATAEPFHFMSRLAATTIQASVRRWIQWKSTRLLLLARKLDWIEENRLRDIARIRQEKWDMMESIQSEIIERERRLEAQVSLAEKLCDHLKRDTAQIRNQTKKLKEFSLTLTTNNEHLDQSVRLNRDNFVTANLAVEFLREKSDTLLATSKKYASRIDEFQAKLESTSRQIEAESQSKLKTKKALDRIIRLLKHRGFVVDLSKGSGNVITHSDSPIDLENIGPNGYDLTLCHFNNDEMSEYSGITNNSAYSSDSDADLYHYNKSATTDHFLGNGTGEILSHIIDELNRTNGSYKSYEKSCDSTVASYSDNKFPLKRQISFGSSSVAGNSFASYGAPVTMLNVATTKNDTTFGSSHVGAHGAVVPPRRRPSSESCFASIAEEVTFNESLDFDSNY